ncbi:hypothetical protein CFB3_18090 [Clostridium folliculivorans]|uniref:Uncharacterized protein n=1 Tax=Clostridium folliculivorans TaxID=2886038 RepID=A0A9W5XYW5_9CLOT|nr:hypothetical protein CFOLD11_04120 [Clostridium folliculivorans]GKU29702.1 hypothetical protein CFB3_18090 [Clostridium folliculivorans]
MSMVPTSIIDNIRFRDILKAAGVPEGKKLGIIVKNVMSLKKIKNIARKYAVSIKSITFNVLY